MGDTTMGPAGKTALSMPLSEALDLTLKAGENVDGHWRQFYTVLFALSAWFSSNFGSIAGRDEAWIISFAIAAYFTVSAIATARAYVILRLIILETKAIAENTNFASSEVQRVVQSKRMNVRLPYRVTMTLLGHIVAAAAVTQLMWKSVH